MGTMAGTTVLCTQYPARVTTNPNPNPNPNPISYAYPNPNPYPYWNFENPHLSSPICIEIITPSAKALAIFIGIALRNVRYHAEDAQTLSLANPNLKPDHFFCCVCL